MTRQQRQEVIATHGDRHNRPIGPDSFGCLTTLQDRLEADQQRPVDDPGFTKSCAGDDPAVQQDVKRVCHDAFMK